MADNISIRLEDRHLEFLEKVDENRSKIIRELLDDLMKDIDRKIDQKEKEIENLKEIKKGFEREVKDFIDGLDKERRVWFRETAKDVKEKPEWFYPRYSSYCNKFEKIKFRIYKGVIDRFQNDDND